MWLSTEPSSILPVLAHAAVFRPTRTCPAKRGTETAFGSDSRAVCCRVSAEAALPVSVDGGNSDSPASSTPILVVAGDVDVGSSISSDGDICVLGRLAGKAHAGCKGNRRAIIRAQQIDSDQVMIADVCAANRFQLQQATLVVCDAEGRLVLKPQREASRQQPSHPTPSQPSSVENQIKPQARRKEAGRRRKAGGRKATGPQPLSLRALQNASPTAKTAILTGFYITALGAALILAPLATFSILFDPRSVSEGFIRVGGLLCVLFGTYYLGAAHGEITQHQMRSLYQSTVLGRVFLSAAFVGMVCMKQADWPLLIPAGVNLLGAVNMHRSLSRS